MKPKTTRSPQEGNTRSRVLQTAERLFAREGFAATSLRDITSAAEANLGAINYHFESKDALIAEVLRQILEPLNDARLALLDEYETKARGKPVKVELILDAAFRPALEMAVNDHERRGLQIKLLARIFSEPGDYLRLLFQKGIADTSQRFQLALRKSLPHLDECDVYWRYHLATGSLLHAGAYGHALEITSKGLCRADEVDDMLRRLISFCAAGLKA